jgi:hypothetical protein
LNTKDQFKEMKNYFKVSLLLSIFIISIKINAKQVDSTLAKTVAVNFLNTIESNPNITSDKAIILRVESFTLEQENISVSYPSCYLINCGIPGFVIVSGDDNITPILGYSDQAILDINNLPPSFIKWMETYEKQISFIVFNKIEGSQDIVDTWNQYKYSNAASIDRRAGAVAPLLKTSWDQSPYYNDQCPYDYTLNKRSITGCVATAMAQVMKFWAYPTSGSGTHSYNHSNYGTLSANFGSTTYDWGLMPNKATSANSSVAILMSHAGISVDMNYSPTGSSATTLAVHSTKANSAEYALKTYFDYSTTLSGKEKKNYSEANWIGLLKTDLEAGQPIIYRGSGNDGGHCFVCDGFNTSNYFHFNWGWGGSANGYFMVSALNPQSSSFTQSQGAIIGISPPTGQINYSLDITKSVTISSSPITFGSSFSISANIKNIGASTFKGTFYAAVYDAKNNFIDFVDSVVESNGLPSGYTYTNNLTFSNIGSVKFIPGTYTVYLFYKPNGGNWKQLYASGLFTSEKTTLKVIHYNTIELYSSMIPATTDFTQGSPASVNLNVQNTGSSAFKGFYQLALFDLDGNFIETINTIEEKNGLTPTYVYKTPFLTFNSSAIEAEPGTYLMALMFADVIDTLYDLVGSKKYTNPIYINVVKAPYLPDKYEKNDNVSIAYSLPITFSNNSGTSTTIGSNVHIQDDIDFYKVILNPGYSYVVTPRLHDLYNSGIGDIFSVDAMFTYSLDNGNTWSESFDDMITAPIIANAGSILFKVIPYFVGNIGEYQLNIKVDRTQKVNVKNTAQNLIQVYPNPSSDRTFYIKENSNVKSVSRIFDCLGRDIQFRVQQSAGNHKIEVDHATPGLYFLELTLNDNSKKSVTIEII